eukprot:13421694-Heterocapsa_arctica.AAC.1
MRPVRWARLFAPAVNWTEMATVIIIIKVTTFVSCELIADNCLVAYSSQNVMFTVLCTQAVLIFIVNNAYQIIASVDDFYPYDVLKLL